MKLKKGSLEAKRFMAKIRAMKSGTKKKTIGATKFLEKKEPKNTKAKRTIQITRSSDGTFKKFKQIGATKFLEKKEPKNTKAKRTIQITRRADGTFKNFKQISGVKLDFAKDLINYVKILEEKNKGLLIAQKNIKNKLDVTSNREMVKLFKNQISSLKKHITSLKKQI